MASVTGKTSIKIDDLINDTIIDGEVVGGHLILRSRGGAEIDAGLVTTSSDVALSIMPVGFIYMSVVPTSPATLFGGGTWVRIGQGRVLVGQDTTQTEFDTAEETGGAKTHTLAGDEMPAHGHAIDHNHLAFDSGSDGNHTHVLNRKAGAGTATGVVRGNTTASADGTTDAGGSHVHNINVPDYTGNSGSTGSNAPHNNLQPFLVVFMWKRTA
jgi:microcystin-dependent protein